MQKNAQNALATKVHNRKLVLNLLRSTPMSRAELARDTGLTRAAMTQIAEELIADGQIRETSRAQTGHRGRAPTLLEYCPDGFFAIGVHLRRLAKAEGCVSITVGVTDFSGSLLASEELRFSAQEPAEQQLSAVAEVILRQRQTLALPGEKLLGIGVSAPGPIDVEKGRLLKVPGLPVWHGCDISRLLSEKTGLPVSLEKDTNADALYNYQMAAFSPRENFLLLSVGTGVGSAIISGGKLLRTSGGFTPEVGHMSIHYQGALCSCGRRGCLETYASVPRLLQHYSSDSWQQLLDSPEGESAMQEETEYLAAGILNLSNLIRVDTVLLTGDVLYGFDRLRDKLKQALQGKSLSLGAEPMKIYPALPAGDCFVQSAANVVFARFLDI